MILIKAKNAIFAKHNCKPAGCHGNFKIVDELILE